MIRTEEDIYFVLRKLSETSTDTITVPQEVEKSGRIRKARIYKPLSRESGIDKKERANTSLMESIVNTVCPGSRERKGFAQSLCQE